MPFVDLIPVPPNSFYNPPGAPAVDVKEFIENFREEGPKKYGVDAFRRNSHVPESVIEDHYFQHRGDVLKEAWRVVRQDLGYKGDCHYNYEKMPDYPFLTILKMAPDIDTSDWPEDDEFAQKSMALFDKVRPLGIRRLAGELKGLDTVAILKWGNEITSLRADTFKQSHAREILDVRTTYTKNNAFWQDWAALLRTKKPTGLRALFSMKSSQEDVYREIESRPGVPCSSPSAYRYFTPMQKMQRGEQIREALEDHYRQQTRQSISRYNSASENKGLAGRFGDIIGCYANALKKNRTRLIEEGALPDTVDTRIRELEKSRIICEMDQAYYKGCAALHLEERSNATVILDTHLPAFLSQMRSAYLKILSDSGSQIATTDSSILGKNGLKNFENELDGLANQVSEVAKEQQELALNAQKTVGHEKPAALIEHHKILALSAPDKADTDETAVLHNTLG